jgi:S-sulfo-L-cysteine synthase (O-acetyl-L-serine-dependent)
VKYHDILGLIGDTPLVGVHQLSPNPNVKIWAKLEGQNPGGSSKDRIALKMIELAERDGALQPNATILEPSSGNTGIGLALVAKLRGYRLRVIMPENVSIERRQLLEIFGAEITLSPGEEGSNGAIRMAEKIHADEPDRYTFLFQYGNPANPLAHYEGTGPEIWRDTDGRVTHFVSSMGTCGTIMGVSRYLKERNSAVQIVGCQPDDHSQIPGIRKWPAAYLPKICDWKQVDRVIEVTQHDAEEMTRKLARDEGIFAGISSGGALWAALEVSRGVENAVIVFIVCDRGDRYLSTGVFPG